MPEPQDERDPLFTREGSSSVTFDSRESSSTGWFVLIIVALALLASGYVVFEVTRQVDIPLVDEKLMGAEVLTIDAENGLTLKRVDGACVQVTTARARFRQIDAECPVPHETPVAESPN